MLSRQLRQEFLVDGQQVPPAGEDALGIGLEVRPSCHEIEVGHVRAVTVEQNDLLEAVIGERLGDVEHHRHEVLVMAVDRAGEVHHVSGVAVTHDRQHEDVFRGRPPGPIRDAQRADEIDIERQVMPMLLDRTAGDDAHLPLFDGIVDLGPGELFVTVLSTGAFGVGHGMGLREKSRLSCIHKRNSFV